MSSREVFSNDNKKRRVEPHPRNRMTRLRLLTSDVEVAQPGAICNSNSDSDLYSHLSLSLSFCLPLSLSLPPSPAPAATDRLTSPTFADFADEGDVDDVERRRSSREPGECSLLPSCRLAGSNIYSRELGSPTSSCIPDGILILLTPSALLPASRA